MVGFLVSAKVLCFVGGVATAVIGTKIAKSEKTRQLCVKTLAKGMMLQDCAKECFQNIKEDAIDIYEDAKKQISESAEVE